MRALGRFEATLGILGAPGIDLDAPWTRSAASVALYGYCRCAERLGRPEALVQKIEAWRERWSDWKTHPSTSDESWYLEWMEGEYERSRRLLRPPT